MADYPKDLLAFRDWLHSEDACRNYLIQLRWPQGLTRTLKGGVARSPR